MKAKLALLLTVAVGSTALVASAQTPPTAYVITSGADGQPPDLIARVPAPPQPPTTVPAAATFPPPPGAALRPVVISGPQARFSYNYSVEEHGVSSQAEALAQQLAAAKSDSDREKIKGQLVEVLEKQFDQRQKRHEEEIKQLEAQLKKLKDLVDKRQENRREIIARRLDQIVKESQGLGW